MNKEVTVRSVVGGMSGTGSFVLMLAETHGNREVPVVIGPHEAQGLLLAARGVETRRPTTHELMRSTLEAFGLHVTRVSIDKVSEGVFYATLRVSDGFNEVPVDSRATDAVTLAILSNAKIEMAEEVLEEAGVSNLQSTTKADPMGIGELEAQLRRLEETEDYERAAEVLKKIDEIKNNSQNH